MTQSTDLTPYLSATKFLDVDHPDIQAYASDITKRLKTDLDKAVALYYAVRDDIIYDPYHIEFTEAGMTASHTLNSRRGYCVAKALVLATVARASGIPARLGFADVKNHLSTKRLQEYMGTDLFVYHGYTELFLSDKWVKATPTFNQSLCEKFNVKPLEFDGINDALFHAHTTDGKTHMEYVKDHGHFADLPIQNILDASMAAYPEILKHIMSGNTVTGDFEEEAMADTQANPEASV